jgi:N4-gp56 family major capsid protein
MALQTTSTAGLTAQFQTAFSKQLLPHIVQELVMDQFASRKPFPKNAGSKTIRFFTPAVADASQVSTLTEGVPLATYRETSLTYVDATLVQYGEVTKISDILGMTALFDVLEDSLRLMGEDAALHLDTVIRNTVVPAITGAGNKRYAGGAANWAALAAGTAAAGTLTMADALDAMTQLRNKRAPRKNGEYFGIAAPAILRDLMLDAKWINASSYSNIKQILKGEVGMFYGIRFIEHTNPWVEDGTAGAEQTYAAPGGAKDIYATLFTGTDSFGVPVMAGQSPFSPRMIINDKPDKADNLNQFVTAGWKTYWVTVVLNALWTVAVRSRTTFA